MPFCEAVDWSLARKRFCAAMVPPSMFAPGPEMVRLPVDAARTGSFQADTVTLDGWVWAGTDDDPPPGEAEMPVVIGSPSASIIWVDPSSTRTSRSVARTAAGPSMMLIAATRKATLL